MQKAFIKLWVRKKKLGEIENLKAYINTITRNHLFNQLRKLAHAEAFFYKMLWSGKQLRAGCQTSGINLYQKGMEKVAAWKNGFFRFDGDNIENAMRQKGRWFDVTIVYEGGTPDGNF